LEELPKHTEAAGTPTETTLSRRNEGKRERANDNTLLNNLPAEDEGEMTAMAKAFLEARQRSKEEAEESE
jgi:hypothetical protein